LNKRYLGIIQIDGIRSINGDNTIGAPTAVAG
jgi:hypothetical protein